ncbi:hypothetical protein CYMTET_52604 [Cymbomonas tetramitiformis]|uniref:Uncharacterized protein n=1 Tax=Cymbomonas tetramitiformis TaxID=36881 RepID=A0AAE0BKJ4_9CHLO|nr:hypothetical protein CYMTET_52604 [Cymbomonas tetramitiformis]
MQSTIRNFDSLKSCLHLHFRHLYISVGCKYLNICLRFRSVPTLLRQLACIFLERCRRGSPFRGLLDFLRRLRNSD